MREEVDVLGSPSQIVLMGLCGRKATFEEAREFCVFMDSVDVKQYLKKKQLHLGRQRHRERRNKGGYIQLPCWNQASKDNLRKV